MMVVFDWILANHIQIAEILGTITGFIYLIYSVRQNILLWFFGILTSALYIHVFFFVKLYADMGLQVYYLFISIYGWINWKYGKGNKEKELPVIRLKMKHVVLLSFISVVIFAFISQVLVHFSDSPVPYLDAFTTALSIVATWMLAKKYIEHWLIWIVVDIVSMGLYFYREIYITVILYFIYTVFAFVGYFQWKKSMNANPCYA